MKKFLKKLFGGIELTWPRVIIFAIVAGIYTALMAMLVPDGNSFHDIAVTVEVWILLAIIVIVNCKTPLEAALKTFIFFLISQPLVYLIQVPFNQMGWGLFGYYRYWFLITLLTLPGAYIGWFIKKDKWYSGVILSAMTVLLAYSGIGFLQSCLEKPLNHLLTTIYCFAIIPILIFAIFKNKTPRLVTIIITAVVTIGILAVQGLDKPYETYNNAFLAENNITFVGEPYISFWTGEGKGNVEIIHMSDGGYNFKISGLKNKTYAFEITDAQNEYDFEYYFDSERQTVVIRKTGEAKIEQELKDFMETNASKSTETEDAE